MTAAAETKAQERRPKPSCAIVIMSRPPVAGLSKRRLARSVGDGRAAEIHQALLHDLLETAGATGEDVYLALSEALPQPSPGWRPPEGTKPLLQQGRDLGQRLNSVLAGLLANGYSSAIALAGDTPRLPAQFLSEAVSELNRAARQDSPGVVVGPAFDGGFYLLGLTAETVRRHGPTLSAILESAPMGGPLARHHVLGGLTAAGLEVHLLPGWVDVDEERDLRVFERLRGSSPERPRADEGAPLKEVYLHLTDRCGRGCPHCYARLGGTRRAPELSTREWESVIEQAAELGTTTYSFIGGDPFLRTDLIALVRRVAQIPDARMRLFFSRSLEPEQVGLLADASEGRMLGLLSLDGPEETNEKIRGKGSYHDGLETLSLMRAAGMEVGVNTVMLAPVLSGLPRLIRDLGRAKIRRLHLILPHERGRLTASPALIPAPNELLPALDAAIEAAAGAGIEIDNLSAWRSRLNEGRDLCSAGCSLLAVDAGGQVHACPITCGDPMFAAGDVRKAPLSEIWTGSAVLRLLRESHTADRETCASCPVADSCGGDCWAQAHYAAGAAGRAGGYGAPSPYCGLLRPLFERLHTQTKGGPASASAAPVPLTAPVALPLAASPAFPVAGSAKPTPFDCI